MPKKGTTQKFFLNGRTFAHHDPKLPAGRTFVTKDNVDSVMQGLSATARKKYIDADLVRVEFVKDEFVKDEADEG